MIISDKTFDILNNIDSSHSLKYSLFIELLKRTGIIESVPNIDGFWITDNFWGADIENANERFQSILDWLIEYIAIRVTSSFYSIKQLGIYHPINEILQAKKDFDSKYEDYIQSFNLVTCFSITDWGINYPYLKYTEDATDEQIKEWSNNFEKTFINRHLFRYPYEFIQEALIQVHEINHYDVDDLIKVAKKVNDTANIVNRAVVNFLLGLEKDDNREKNIEWFKVLSDARNEAKQRNDKKIDEFHKEVDRVLIASGEKEE